MCCADFCFWKTLPSMDLRRILFFGVTGKLCAYSRIANALRETWGNDARLWYHDIALSQQLQNGHIVGSAHWTGEEDEWQETDPDHGESAEPWCDGSGWHDTKGYEYELYSEETDWNENCYETPRLWHAPLILSLNPFLLCWINLSKHTRET